MQQVEHDARARGADRVAQRDGAAVDVQFLHVQLTHGVIEAEFVAAIGIACPCRNATEQLCGKGLVDLPGIEVVQCEIVALQYGGRGVHRAQAHLGRVEARPLTVEDAAKRRQAVALHRLFACQQHPGRAVGDLR